MKRIGKIVCFSAMSLIALSVIALNVACYELRSTLNQFASYTPVSVTNDVDVSAGGKVLADQIVTEGAVLVKNDGTLPLSKSKKKVNVFGWSSTQWIFCGSGSGRVVSMDKDFLGALQDYGIEANASLASMYRSFLSTRPLYNNNEGSLHSYSSDFSVLYEPRIEDSAYYSDTLLEEAKVFSDTAFVVLSRVSGESNDCPKVQYYCDTRGTSNKKTDQNRNYLDISNDERDLLDYVTKNYAHTVVLINSTNAMNLSFLSDYPAIGACLITGATGQSAAEALPPLLYGDTNFSGRLTDTYVYDFKSLPSYANSGPLESDATHERYASSGGYYPADGSVYSNVGNDSARYATTSFVDYCEDIYLGYKYFETADKEGVFNAVDNAYGKGYDGVVQFPFGYGLSYTDFSQKIVGVSLPEGASVGANDEIQLTVEVKNTGGVSGKDVVELYLGKPYAKGGIEKSAVELIDYGKTALLAPGASENVTLKAKVSDFASYDDLDKNHNGFKGYEIEKGDYSLKIGASSHAMIDGVAYSVAAPLTFEEDPITKATVKNRFLETSFDGVSIDGSDSGQDITYLSRDNFKATFTDEMAVNRPYSQALKSNNLYTAKMANEFINDDDEAITFGENNGLKAYESGEATELGLALGKDPSSQRWDELLNQLSWNELLSSSLHGYVHNEAISSIGKPKTTELDGPSQIGSFNVSVSGFGYPNPTLIAQTFSKDLAYQFGKQIGKETLLNGYDGWYAPGVNLHRTPFGGRNYEFYSEDPYLSGMTAAFTVKGSLNMGVYVYMKHFICDEQEIYRDGLYTWLREQNLRENYLRPFRIAIDVGGLSGVMTSYNRLGATWAGGNYNLIHDVLEGEWAFKGAVITDYADHQNYMNMDQALRAGGSLYMDGWLNNGSYRYETTSNTFRKCLREAARRNIYAFLNAKYTAQQYQLNGDGDFVTVHKGASFAWWKAVLYSVDGVTIIGLGLWAFFLLKKKKPRKAARP